MGSRRHISFSHMQITWSESDEKGVKWGSVTGEERDRKREVINRRGGRRRMFYQKRKENNVRSDCDSLECVNGRKQEFPLHFSYPSAFQKVNCLSFLLSSKESEKGKRVIERKRSVWMFNNGDNLGVSYETWNLSPHLFETWNISKEILIFTLTLCHL